MIEGITYWDEAPSQVSREVWNAVTDMLINKQLAEAKTADSKPAIGYLAGMNRKARRAAASARRGGHHLS